MSTKHKSINPETIDFSATSLDTHNSFKIYDIEACNDIEWLSKSGECVLKLRVMTVLKWIEANKLHVPEDMEAHECDSLKWLDDNFGSATKAYFMDVYAMEESEVRND